VVYTTGKRMFHTTICHNMCSPGMHLFIFFSSVNLSHFCVGAVAACALAEALEAAGPDLSVSGLDFSGNRVTAEGCRCVRGCVGGYE
jgi:hypothetical protein